MRISDEYEPHSAVHGMQKVEGIIALEKSRIVLEEDVSVGDTVSWFELPDGKLLISKDPEGVCIERVSSAYYHLETEIEIEEK